MIVYCAVSIDGDLRLGGPGLQKVGVLAMRQVHTDLSMLGSTSWLINEHDFHWTELHPEILLQLADSGECIGLHDHLDTHFLENESEDRLFEFLSTSRRQIKDFYLRNGREIALSVHRNGCAQQGTKIYRTLSGLGYTILSDVWPGMKWHSRMIPIEHPIQPWKCLSENDPGSILTDNRYIPQDAFPWRHDADNWLDVNSRVGHFLHVPITCLPWIDQERVKNAINPSREQVFLVIDTHPYDLQDPETGKVSAERVEKYRNSLEWVRDIYKAIFVRIDQIPGLISIHPENEAQERVYENCNRR